MFRKLTLSSKGLYMATYADKLFRSCKNRAPRLYRGLTTQKWLDGEGDIRRQLREVGQRAAKIKKIKDLQAARADWVSFTGGGNEWVRHLIDSVPLLFEAAHRSRLDDEVFVHFMKDLATLAKL